MPAPSATSCGARCGSRPAASKRSPRSATTSPMTSSTTRSWSCAPRPTRFAAYHNVCSHRGRRLDRHARRAPRTPAAARRKSFVCGFHGWTLRPRRRVHARPREGRLEGRADAREHAPGDGQGRHLGRLDLDQHGSRCEPLARLSRARREHARSVRAAEHALPVAQVADLRLQLEGRDGGVQRDLPRPHDASGVQEVRRVPRLGQGAGQAQQHRLRRAQGPGREPRPSCASAPGDPRMSTAEMQVYTWRRPTPTPRRRWSTPRSGWSTSCRKARRPTRCSSTGWIRRARDDAARGVIWPTSIPAHRRQERHRLADLPELPDRPRGQQHAVLQRAAYGYDPDKCIFEARSTSCSRKGRSRRPSGCTPPRTTPGAPSCRRTSPTWRRCSRA